MSEQDIKSYIDNHASEAAAFLAELVKVPSSNPPGDCAPHAMRAAELLEGLGFTVERYPVPDDLVKANGMISATNLVVRKKFGASDKSFPTIALNSHGDVVPPGEGWTMDPFGAEIKDGWMYGRGVAVSKSDFASYAFALKALEDSGADLNGTIELHFTYDEEAGGEIGPKWLLDEGISKPDFSIGAGFSYKVVTAHNGCLHLEVEVNGRSAHAALPDTGHDALEAANSILSALYAERATYKDRVSPTPGIGTPQLTVGLISGGINTNVVPDRVTFRLDRRAIPEESLDEVEASLRAVIEAATTDLSGINVSVRRILAAQPLAELPGSEKLSEALCRRAGEVLGCAIETGGVPLYTDARHYTAAGIPTVLYGAGPRSIEEANAHRADERLPLGDLRAATEVIALTLYDLLG